MRTFSVGRAAFVLVVIALSLAGMTLRVAYLQTYARQQHITAAEREHHTTMTTYARRGTITDCNGIVMAATVQNLDIYVDPKFMLKEYQKEPRTPEEMDGDLAKLARLTDLDPVKLRQLIDQKSESQYLKISEGRDELCAEEVLKLKMPGVGIEPVCVRYYPMGSLAAHVLGDVGKDGRGLEGMELRFERVLAGENGVKRLEKDAQLRPIGMNEEDYIPATHGQHVVLTIDANIQMLAEEELKRACEEFHAKRGEVVVIDPLTGNILAMANYPTFNPQNPGDSAPESRRNACIVVPYEPGSTEKPFMMGPALAWGITHVTEVWNTSGPYWPPNGRRKPISDVHGGYASLCTWDILVKSSNIGMCKVAERMGNVRIWQALTSFGFGRRTGIELPGEDPGLLNPLRKWTHQSTESVAQGYEVMITPLQLGRAFCAYANGGHLVNPHLVKGFLDAEGNVVERQRPTDLRDLPRVIDEATAADVRQILSDVVIRGTAKGHGSKAYTVFGKTGTSHISLGRLGYSEKYNSSFVAGAPLENPKLVVAMVIHEPSGASAYGGTVAAPAAVRVLERSLSYMQVPASPPLALPPANVMPLLYNFNADRRLYGEERAQADE